MKAHAPPRLHPFVTVIAAALCLSARTVRR